MKRNVLIIGAGGVAHVVAHKCAQNNALLGHIHIASRTLSKCQAIIDSIHTKGSLQQPGAAPRQRRAATERVAVRRHPRRAAEQSAMVDAVRQP